MLYKIKILHGAPKDSHESIETYLVAEDDKSVAKWIDREKNFGYWKECTQDGVTRYDEDSDKEISLWDYVLKNRGDLQDEEGWEDSYYGVTKWGWEPIEATKEQIKVLLELRIAQNA